MRDASGATDHATARKRTMKNTRDIKLGILILLAITASAAHGQAAKEADRVHFLLAIDTVDGAANALGLDLDRDRMVKAIHDSMKTLGYQEGPNGKYTITI